MVRDLDPYSKRRVQAILRRCGRGQDTDLRILSDGEDGLRGDVGTWFGKKCQLQDLMPSMFGGTPAMFGGGNQRLLSASVRSLSYDRRHSISTA